MLVTGDSKVPTSLVLKDRKINTWALRTNLGFKQAHFLWKWRKTPVALISVTQYIYCSKDGHCLANVFLSLWKINVSA